MSEAADALYYEMLAGYDVGEAIAGLEPIMQASIAGNAELGLTSDLVTKIVLVG